MPIINIDMTAQPKKVKEKIIRDVSSAVSKATGIPRDFCVVIIRELKNENVGWAGEPLDVYLKRKKSRSGLTGGRRR